MSREEDPIGALERVFPITKRTLLAALGGTLVLAAVSIAALIPEHILYRQRLLFSIFDLGDNITLRPFDHRTHDMLTLRSWYSAPKEDKPTIVYFAGRDGDLIRKPAHLFALAEEGYGLLLAGYRGYGGNPGYPSERTMFLDASALLFQAQEAGLAPNGYILYGYSMGSAIASNAAAQVRPRGLILEAPISRFIEAVRQQASHVPAWLVRTRFDNRARIAELSAPVLLLAGGRDAVTPPLFARTLAAANPRFATVTLIEEANHVNIIRLGGRDAVRRFVESIVTTPPLESDDGFEDVRLHGDPSRRG